MRISFQEYLFVWENQRVTQSLPILLLHVQDVQFANPSVTVKFDVDPKATAAQRKLALTDAAKNGYLVALDHAYFPGVGHVQKEGDHFRWIPVPYINDAQKAR